MSNRTNHRRGEGRRTEHGPRWENPNPGHGCNSTHVARARKKWKQITRRQERRIERNSMTEQHKTDPQELKPELPDVPEVQEGTLVLAAACFERLAEAFNPDTHPSLIWVQSLTEAEQRECLRWASCVVLHATNTNTVVPPAPQCLKTWADDAIPKIVLAFREGEGGLGEITEGVLERLHDRLDMWFRRVALGCGSADDGAGPFPSFKVELAFEGYDESDGELPMISAHIVESTSEVV